MRILLFYGLNYPDGQFFEPRRFMVGTYRLEVNIQWHVYIGCRLRRIILLGFASELCGRPKLQLVLKRMVLVIKHEDTLPKSSARTG